MNLSLWAVNVSWQHPPVKIAEKPSLVSVGVNRDQRIIHKTTGISANEKERAEINDQFGHGGDC
jgi:hypothetical protein